MKEVFKKNPLNSLTAYNTCKLQKRKKKNKAMIHKLDTRYATVTFLFVWFKFIFKKDTYENAYL